MRAPTDLCLPQDPCRLPAGYARFGNLGFDIQTTAMVTEPGPRRRGARGGQPRGLP
jgi:hypothetical protein